ncbi:hypothetical protein MPNT_490001 [Candidatus Methylacidithermus pantelleriae]|uniref:Uncharacterized protein n=1 Tax=Candidatus Methylacidithermus pantelleriae TaxID=2744239 RepID=A0A8J2FTE6_9BACT|nr:hypothetical protein MPNT_490001 [Candidatus Methylacidithermus pantelleriae]
MFGRRAGRSSLGGMVVYSFLGTVRVKPNQRTSKEGRGEKQEKVALYFPRFYTMSSYDKESDLPKLGSGTRSSFS